MKAKYAILDTGVSYSLIPTNDFLQITKGLEDGFGVNCKEPSGSSSLTSVYSCSCEDFGRLPNIKIGLSTDEKRDKDKWFSLPKESYMERDDKGGCSKLLLTPSAEKFGLGDPSEYWVLGDIFLQNYYSIYDYPKGLVGLIESRGGGVAPAVEKKPDNTKLIDEIVNGMTL